ncbi:restriction endonuclease subunit S [Citrobacter freundii]|uniref:restriction endonuclease subunit S n=1 Tax=Citrobacter freundii TaxID=546 RepID=UPI0015E97EA2|nr:restriction endonuclease subunit S [Citrobacter freundii]QMB06632.1 restriction endonuclease subunit S [Citrobacter freundii]
MVPKGWKIATLKDLLDGQIKNGYSPNATDSETGYWVLSLGALADEGINSSGIKPVLPEEKVLQNLLKKDDFLVSRSNTPDKVGRSIRFKNEIENCSYPDLMMRFRIDDTKADKEFIEQQLKSSTVRAYFKNCAAGSSSTMVKINKGILEKTPIVVPPIKEQKKIAKILSTWDNAISVTEKLLTNSQQQKKALMQQLLTGEKRLLDEDGVRFCGEWKWLRAAELFKTISQRNNSEDEELLAVTQDLGVIPRSMLERRVVMPDGSTKGYKLVVPGNFIISLRSFQGGLEYSRYRGLVSPAYTVLTPIKKIVDEFYEQYYKSYDFIGHLAVAVIGIRDGKQISYEDFSFLKLPYPEIEEQQKIAAVLSAADVEISTLEKKLACLKDEKKALMQQLLTGKRRVKVDEAVAA